jgi:DNA polymerase elongation subunit (family B)
MIVDIENINGQELNISYFNREGEIDYLKVKVPTSERFIWNECSPNDEKRDSDYLTWDEKPVKKIRTYKLNKYRMVEILATTDPEILAPIYEFNIPQKFYLDIETEIVDGFPDAESAKTPITSISMVGGTKKNNITFGLKDLSPKEQARIENDVNKHFESIGKKFTFKYVKFESEYDMLVTFFTKYIQRMPLLTGWNFIGYDWKYLINRCKKYGIDPGLSSPSGKLLGKNQLPQHRLIVDYLEIYKKWDRLIKIKESNKLDYVGEAALGIKKFAYSGSLKELYEKDFEKFILYNAVDTNLVCCIDEKLQTLLTFLNLASISKVEINKAFSPIWITENLMSELFLKRKRVFVWKEKDQDQVHFEGAYVKEPEKGLHKFVACYDFASLYPNTMMQWGISPESYKGKNLIHPNDRLTKSASGAYFDQEYQKPILKSVLEDFYGKRKERKKDYLEAKKDIDKLEKIIKEGKYIRS